MIRQSSPKFPFYQNSQFTKFSKILKPHPTKTIPNSHFQHTLPSLGHNFPFISNFPPYFIIFKLNYQHTTSQTIFPPIHSPTLILSSISTSISNIILSTSTFQFINNPNHQIIVHHHTTIPTTNLIQSYPMGH